MKLILRDTVAAIALIATLSLGLFNTTQAYSSNRLLENAKMRGSVALKTTTELQSLMEQNIGSTEIATSIAINHFFNKRIVYNTDQQLYNMVDYWASPMETASIGRGDCEDYSIAKYFVLLASGVSSEKLRMVYVKATTSNGIEGHMVLAYYPTLNDEPVILDNLINDIKPASHRQDLKPVYSFNTDGLWGETGKNSLGDPMVRISKWRNVIEKVKTEGF